MVRLVERIEGAPVVCYGVEADNYEEAKEVALEMYARELAELQAKMAANLIGGLHCGDCLVPDYDDDDDEYDDDEYDDDDDEYDDNNALGKMMTDLLRELGVM